MVEKIYEKIIKIFGVRLGLPIFNILFLIFFVIGVVICGVLLTKSYYIMMDLVDFITREMMTAPGTTPVKQSKSLEARVKCAILRENHRQLTPNVTIEQLEKALAALEKRDIVKAFEQEKLIECLKEGPNHIDKDIEGIVKKHIDRVRRWSRFNNR
jgi:hypothetical protein